MRCSQTPTHAPTHSRRDWTMTGAVAYGSVRLTVCCSLQRVPVPPGASGEYLPRLEIVNAGLPPDVPIALYSTHSLPMNASLVAAANPVVDLTLIVVAARSAVSSSSVSTVVFFFAMSTPSWSVESARMRSVHVPPPWSGCHGWNDCSLWSSTNRFGSADV